MKYVSRFAMVAALGATLVGCGQRVEVPQVMSASRWAPRVTTAA